MLILAAALCGFVPDLLFGNLSKIPLVLMGHYITYVEMFLHARLPQTSRGEQLNDAILSASLPLLVFSVMLKLCRFAALIHPTAGLCCKCNMVRKEVSHIVGRDMEHLHKSGRLWKASRRIFPTAAL